MGDCRRFLDRLTAYVDELLSPEERAEIEQHLAACPPCQDCACDERTARLVLRARGGGRAQEGGNPPRGEWGGAAPPGAHRRK
jgi:anti-sigma factor RsiW